MELTDEIAVKVIEKADSLGLIAEDEVYSGIGKAIQFANELLLDADDHPHHKAAKELLRYADTLFAEKPKVDKHPSNTTNRPWQEEGLPVPGYVDIADVPDMPVDLTTCTDEEIRRYHSIFNAYFVRASYLVMLQENELETAKLNHKQFINRELLGIDPFYREGNRAPKEKTKMIIEAEMYQNEDLVASQDKVQQLENDLRAVKTFRDIYENNCTRLSREGSMRYSEHKHG